MTLDPRVDIGHVHLKVADLDRALGFWRDVLGFEEQARMGDQAAFISAGGYHHHIGLNTWESRGGSPPPPGTTGLYHVAIRYPTRAALADALRRLLQAGIRLDGASDHGVSEALNLRDPDGYVKTFMYARLQIRQGCTRSGLPHLLSSRGGVARARGRHGRRPLVGAAARSSSACRRRSGSSGSRAWRRWPPGRQPSIDRGRAPWAPTLVLGAGGRRWG